MPQVYISIGSNIEPARSVRGGVAALREDFGHLTLSSVYESEAVGFVGDNFYNLVAAFSTELPVREVAALLHDIERRQGRERGAERFSPRTLDLDLLLYGDLVLREPGLELPRDEITKHAFVLWPLAEIAPDARHPVLGETYASLWAAFDRQDQPLWPVALRV